MSENILDFEIFANNYVTNTVKFVIVWPESNFKADKLDYRTRPLADSTPNSWRCDERDFRSPTRLWWGALPQKSTRPKSFLTASPEADAMSADCCIWVTIQFDFFRPPKDGRQPKVGRPCPKLGPSKRREGDMYRQTKEREG